MYTSYSPLSVYGCVRTYVRARARLCGLDAFLSLVSKGRKKEDEEKKEAEGDRKEKRKRKAFASIVSLNPARHFQGSFPSFLPTLSFFWLN